MTAQEWRILRSNIPHCWSWPEVWGGCVMGAIGGVLLLEFIMYFFK